MGTAAHYPAASPHPWPHSPGIESFSPGPLGLRHQVWRWHPLRGRGGEEERSVSPWGKTTAPELPGVQKLPNHRRALRPAVTPRQCRGAGPGPRRSAVAKKPPPSPARTRSRDQLQALPLPLESPLRPPGTGQDAPPRPAVCSASPHHSTRASFPELASPS